MAIKTKKLYFLYLALCSSVLSFSQAEVDKTLEYDIIFNNIRTFNLSKIDSSLLSKSKLSLSEQVFSHLLKGDFTLREISNKTDTIPFSHYLKALNISKQINSEILICESLKRILTYHFKTQENPEAFVQYSKAYNNYAYDEFEQAYAGYFFAGSSLSKMYKLKDGSEYPLKPILAKLSLAEKNKFYFLVGRINQVNGVYYDIIHKDYYKAETLYKEAIKNYEQQNYYFSRKHAYDITFNLGSIEREKHNYKKSLSLLKSINISDIQKKDLKDIILIYDNIYLNYKSLKQPDSALIYLEKKQIIEDSLKVQRKGVEIRNILTRYKVVEKEKELLIAQRKRKQNQNLLIASLIILLFGSIFAFLIQKNTRKKQKLAEQEKALETQKLATVLKEQELLSIDAMIEGQEKERQRIANDLHDDLGGLMATVKLHFNALKDKQTPELYTKTNTLIDEAYNKVRSVAHAKNSGVIAKQGLLKAITEMTDKISALNKITIDVIDHGLENRLENSLELTIFRIVQELITNIIKHANATEATIHITNHDDSLNIMVEDNGIGFNPSQITKTKKGMGISSIDKRVEHLNGNMTIESEPNKGTTIIIDIPL